MSRRQFIRTLVRSGVAFVAAAAFTNASVPTALVAPEGRGSIVVSGFIGSETQLAAEIDKLLIRRSRE